MFSNVMVPVDGSDPSDAAISFALRLAQEEGAQLTFAHVVEVAKIVSMTATSAINPGVAVDLAERAGKQLLDEACTRAQDAKVSARSELLEGECVSTLLDFAQRKGVDLIVIGSHGRGGLSRVLLGSVAEGVLRRATIPLLVTHAPRKAEAVLSTN